MCFFLAEILRIKYTIAELSGRQECQGAGLSTSHSKEAGKQFLCNLYQNYYFVYIQVPQAKEGYHIKGTGLSIYVCKMNKQSSDSHGKRTMPKMTSDVSNLKTRFSIMIILPSNLSVNFKNFITSKHDEIHMSEESETWSLIICVFS